MHDVDPPSARYLVVSAEGEDTTTAAQSACREEALAVARALTDRGHRLWIMRIEGARAECATRDDDAQIQSVAAASARDVGTRALDA